MKQERWEIRSTEKILHFFLWNQKNKGLITLSGINQSSAIVKKMRWKWNFFTTAKCLLILWILSIHPTYTWLSFIQSLYLHLFFFHARTHFFPIPSVFAWNATWLFCSHCFLCPLHVSCLYSLKPIQFHLSRRSVTMTAYDPKITKQIWQ